MESLLLAGIESLPPADARRSGGAGNFRALAGQTTGTAAPADLVCTNMENKGSL
jgi:hypothetical protein